MLIHIISVRLVTVSMHVNAWNENTLGPMVTFHGLMRSKATSNHGAINASRGGRWPYPMPRNFVHWHVSHDCTNILILLF